MSGRNGGNLEPDIAGTDDEKPFCALEVESDRLYVVDRSQIMNTAQVRAGYVEASRLGACGEQQVRIFDIGVAAHNDPFSPEIE